MIFMKNYLGNNMSNIEIEQCTQSVLDSIKSDEYAGYDPFDGLNSKLFDRFPNLKKTVFLVCYFFNLIKGHLLILGVYWE